MSAMLARATMTSFGARRVRESQDPCYFKAAQTQAGAGVLRRAMLELASSCNSCMGLYCN